MCDVIYIWIKERNMRMKKIGILHISDVHISESSISDIDKLVRKLISDIKKVQVEKKMRVDIICFAGDLIERGDKALSDEKQLRIAEEHFVQPLLEQLKLSKQQFILVPGNHEVNKKEIAKRIEAGLSSIASLEEINDTVYEMDSSYNKRLQYFYKYMYENYVTDANQWKLGYSLNRHINGINVGIVGIDSSWRSTGAGYTERGNMLVGEQQVGVLYDSIKDCDLKICIMHHPLDWISQLEMSNIERRLNQFDLVLRGHVHDLDDKQISTQRYKTIYNTSGKLFPIDEYYSGYSLINVDTEINKCKIYSREYYAKPREEFDQALRINKNGETEYLLMAYDEEKVIEYDLKLQLKDYFQRVTEKYAMLRSVDSNSPERVTDFFVEPTIKTKSEYDCADIAKEEEKDINIPLQNIILGDENIILIGKKECGKTTVLQHIGISHTEPEGDKIPVYIDMLNLPKGQDRVLNAYKIFVLNTLSNEVALSKGQLINLLENGKILCLIDNVNISNTNHIKWIQLFTTAYPSNRFIFAVEEKFYQTCTIKEIPYLGVECKTVYLQSFGKKQVREMVTKWGAGKEGFDANAMTQRIITYCGNTHFTMTPFNIAVFMTIWDIDKNFVPINEGKVMRTYLETVLDKFSAEGVQRSTYDFDIKQNFLGYVAYSMFKKNEYYFRMKEFEELVDEYHKCKGYRKSDTKFDLIFFEKNILYVSGEYVFFSNTAIMEYCLAYYASVDNDLYRIMIKKGNRSNFIHELSFYSGIVLDCTTLLDELSLEITETLIENIDVLDEIEKINIHTEFNVDKHNFEESIIKNRKSMNEIDDLACGTTKLERSPMEISKIQTVEDGESFMDLLIIYGNAIKNAEIINAAQKKNHVDMYIMGMNFQFGLLLKEISCYLTSKTKEELPEEILSKHPELTDKEFEEMKEAAFDLIKIVIPISMQFYIADNIGTPKLELIITELISEKSTHKFTKFMLSFLSCDMSDGNIKSFLIDYIRKEDSKNIRTLIMLKVILYYSIRYFGNNPKIDSELLDVVAEAATSLKEENIYVMQKGIVKQQLKLKYDSVRAKRIE